LAWLHSAPKRHDKDDNPPSRLRSLTDDSPAKALPDADDYITMCFDLSGMCLSGAMGAVPLTWQEVGAFIRHSGYSLDGWEAEQVIKMSMSYCSMLSKANKLGCPPPYQKGITSEDAKQAMRDRVSAQWDAFEKKLEVKKRA